MSARRRVDPELHPQRAALAASLASRAASAPSGRLSTALRASWRRRRVGVRHEGPMLDSRPSRGRSAARSPRPSRDSQSGVLITPREGPARTRCARTIAPTSRRPPSAPCAPARRRTCSRGQHELGTDGRADGTRPPRARRAATVACRRRGHRGQDGTATSALARRSAARRIRRLRRGDRAERVARPGPSGWRRTLAGPERRRGSPTPRPRAADRGARICGRCRRRAPTPATAPGDGARPPGAGADARRPARRATPAATEEAAPGGDPRRGARARAGLVRVRDVHGRRLRPAGAGEPAEFNERVELAR